jgi:DNA-binding IclR family transcriptional regulator
MPANTFRTITSRAALAKRLVEVRKQGYSINWEERTVGVASVAAPVIDADSNLLCILSLGFATSQIKRDDIGRLGALVRNAAALLCKKLRERGMRDAA